MDKVVSMRIRKLHRTCAAFPSQWEGELENGQAIYVRARYGELYFVVGDSVEEALRNPQHSHGIDLEAKGLLFAISTALMMSLLGLEKADGFEYEDDYGEAIDADPLGADPQSLADRLVAFCKEQDIKPVVGDYENYRRYLLEDEIGMEERTNGP